MLSLLFLSCILINSSVYGSICQGSNKTTYLRSAGTRLMEFATFTIKDISLNSCADSCTSEVNGHKCSSFEYDSINRECSIHEENGQPIGPSVLAKATESSLSFFQQLCIQDEHLCSSPYTFERYPQSMLMGLAMTVEITEGLSECLSKCLKNQATLSSSCTSVMYFYETGECVMNRASKENHPHLFKTEVQDKLVDYFENICLDVSCPSVHWLRSEEYTLSAEKDVIIESMSAEECKALCASNVIGEDKFPCHSFIYTASKEECHLSADLNAFNPSNPKNQGNKKFNLNPISSGEYLQKICLNSTIRCIDASYEQVRNHKIDHPPYKTIHTVSVHHCLSACIDDGPQCASVTFDYNMDLCQLSEFSQFSKPDAFIFDSDFDYFDKICDSVPLPSIENTTSVPSSTSKPVAKGALNQDGNEQVLDEEILNEFKDENQQSGSKISQTVTHAEQTVIDDEKDFQEKIENGTKAKLSTECRMSGVSVSVDFAQNTTGTIFIKDHFATCKAEFHNSTNTVLHIPFPNSDENNPRCPGIELSPSHWSFMVVVQRNEMESPLLLTSTDRVFNITCDYTELIENTSNNIGLQPFYEEKKPKYNEHAEVKSEKIKMEILRNGSPVTIVPLGEVVELRWNVVNPEEGLGFFINECVAERVGGPEPQPEPLKIIYRGCPEEKVKNRLMDSIIEVEPEQAYTTRLKVFRFDGSRRVRIKCTIDVCIDRCEPIFCDGLLHKSGESYGRKKRQSMEDLKRLMNRLRPDFRLHDQHEETEAVSRSREKEERRVVTGTLTVLDLDDTDIAVPMTTKKKSEKSRKKTRPEYFISSSGLEERMCFMRWQVASAGAGIAILLIFSIFVSTYVIHIKCIRSVDRHSCSSSLSGTTYSSEYTTSSDDFLAPCVPRHSTPAETAYAIPHQLQKR